MEHIASSLTAISLVKRFQKTFGLGTANSKKFGFSKDSKAKLIAVCCSQTTVDWPLCSLLGLSPSPSKEPYPVSPLSACRLMSLECSSLLNVGFCPFVSRS